MDYRRFGETIVLRLDPGEDIIGELERLAALEDIRLAEINGLGAVDDFTVGVFDLAEKAFRPRRFRGAHEVTSLHGTITGQRSLHLHMNAADAEGRVWGGHLVSARVSVTAEIVVRLLDGRVDRTADAAFGLNLLAFGED